MYNIFTNKYGYNKNNRVCIVLYCHGVNLYIWYKTNFKLLHLQSLNYPHLHYQ